MQTRDGAVVVYPHQKQAIAISFEVLNEAGDGVWNVCDCQSRTILSGSDPESSSKKSTEVALIREACLCCNSSNRYSAA
jgi:hypothetical protein